MAWLKPVRQNDINYAQYMLSLLAYLLVNLGCAGCDIVDNLMLVYFPSNNTDSYKSTVCHYLYQFLFGYIRYI
jgi:hypothetical protein